MNIPKKGYYTHYKHDPAGEKNNFTYEICDIARHTEDGNLVVLYRPLYKAGDWIKPASMYARPVEMFGEIVKVGEKEMSRFTQITDSQKIAELEKVKAEMYGADFV